MASQKSTSAKPFLVRVKSARGSLQLDVLLLFAIVPRFPVATNISYKWSNAAILRGLTLIPATVVLVVLYVQILSWGCVTLVIIPIFLR